jgi:uncharacterized damage-inducible protein DinB
MSAAAPARPEADEYAPYFEGYVSLVPADVDIADALARQLDDALALLRSVGEERAGSRYAEGKWSVKELVGHVADAERVFAYRLLRVARGDRTPMEGFEQDDFIRGANFDSRTLTSITEEFESARRATLTLLRPLGAETMRRRGVANGGEVSARALAYIMHGHVTHHLNILRERYL